MTLNKGTREQFVLKTTYPNKKFQFSGHTDGKSVYYRVVAGKYVTAMVFREDRVEGVLFQKKMRYHIF